MKIINSSDLLKFKEKDWVLGKLKEFEARGQPLYTSDNWLLESEAKRVIFDFLYSDMTVVDRKLSILDVGAGLCSLSKQLFSHHNYDVVDLFHHEEIDTIKSFQLDSKFLSLFQTDWLNFVPQDVSYDIIISNDLFPNVDQRLDEFIEKYIPHAKEIRLSLTYYNVRKTYQVKRVDGDEVFFIRPWNALQLAEILKSFEDRIENPDFDALLADTPSVFPNGRQVCVITIRGDG